MNVITYIQALTQSLADKPWNHRWIGEHCPYLYLPASDPTDEVLRFYLSAGIHGDEPAGPMAVLSLLQEEQIFEGLEVHLFPLLNPRGLAAGTRETPDGVDLNRNYGPVAHPAPETQWHLTALESLPAIDVAVCLHEDWEATGAYLYHVEPKQARFTATRVLAVMAEQVSVETSCVIDGSQACEGIISRQESDYPSDDWPETVYLTRTRTRAAFTLETPTSAPIKKRVEAHCAAVCEVLHQLRARDNMN